jgi:proteasome accessory factor C
MSRDEEKLVRQLSLLSFLLSRPRPFTAREVQESVEGYAGMSDDTFTRRFYADRADLAKAGIEIRIVGGPETFGPSETQSFLLGEEDFHLPQVDFTPAELQALTLALAALDGRFAYARPLRLALTAISHGRKDRVHDELDLLPVALAPDEDARRAGRQLAHLENAVARGRTVRFLYPTARDAAAHEERTVDPYSLFLIQGHWYVVGRDHTRDAIRTFRVTRIKGQVRYLTEKVRDFSIPEDYDPAAYRARPPWLLGPVRGTAVLTVGDDLAWLVERLGPHVEALAEGDAGCARFAVPYADERVLLSWVAGLGGCASLAAPAEPRDRLREGLLEVALLHTGVPETVEAAPALTEAAGAATPRPGRAAAGDAPIPAGTGASEPIAPERLARAIALLHYLLDAQTPDVVPWEAVSRDLGLTRGEVEEDLSLFNVVNFGGGTYALYAEATEKGIHVIPDVMADTFARPARLSPLMARALLLALDLIGGGLAVPGLESLASVRAKVEALVGPAASSAPVILDDLSPADPALLETLNQAIQSRRVVTLEYFTASRQELAERPVEPYLLFRNPDGWYLEAYCLLARGQRTFKVERIRSARPTDAEFTPRAEVDLTPRRGGRAFLPGETARWAAVRFHPRWRRHLEEQGVELMPLADGALRAHIPYADEGWLAQEVIRYLGDAVVEQPLSARDRVRERAAALAARYEGEGDPSGPGGPA